MSLSALLQKEYCRLFYPTAKGWTPILPEPREGFEAGPFKAEGLEIGDLVLRSGNGELWFAAFNVTQLPGSPRNQGRVPAGFKPLDLVPNIDFTCDKTRFTSPSLWSATNDIKKPFQVSTAVKCRYFVIMFTSLWN